MDSGCLRTGGAVIMGHRRPKPRTIELVKSSYQPTKAELEEEISLEVPGETAMDRLGKSYPSNSPTSEHPVDYEASKRR